MRPIPKLIRTATTWIVGSSSRWLAVQVVVVLAVGVSLTYFSFMLTKKNEAEQFQLVFEQIATHSVGTLEQGIRTTLDEVGDIVSLFDASEIVDRDEFQAFTSRSLEEHPGITALEWAPRIRSENRSTFVESVRSEGFLDFDIKQLDTSSALSIAGPRQEYFPIKYVVPISGNESILGFDIATDSTIFGALEMAIETGNVVASEPVPLIQGLEGGFGLIVIAPVFRGDVISITGSQRRSILEGVSLGVFSGESLANEIVSGEFDSEIHLSVGMVNSSGDVIRLTEIGSRATNASESYTANLRIAERDWVIHATPTSDWQHASPALKQSNLVLGVGILVTLTVLGFMRHSAQVTSRIENQVLRRTEELHVEAVARERSERELNRFFTSALDMLCVAGLDGYFKRLNPAFTVELGYDEQTLLATPFIEFVHSDDKNDVMGALQQIGQGADLVGFICRFISADGEPIWLQWKAAAAQNEIVYASARNITAQIEFQDALSDREESLSALIRAIPDEVIRVDSQSTIQEYSEGVGTGSISRGRTGIVGRNLDELLPAEISALYQENFNEAIAREKLTLFEYSQGDEVLEVRAHAVENNELLVLIRKITDRVMAERVKSEFLSMVSHELRTPLTSVRGSLGLLQGRLLVDAGPQIQNMLTIGINNVDRLTRLINDILDIERAEAGAITLEKTDVDVLDVVTKSTSAVSALASEKSILLKQDLHVSTLYCDADRIIQVLVNLIGNAIKFSESGQQITVSAHDENENVRFSVEDQGRGIPEDKVDTIFDRFQQVDASDTRTHGGAGLGLAITRSLVELHKGRIWAKSVLGVGSKFQFTIPKYENTPEP